MYAGYFGLSQAPFSIAPDPRYLYMSERHREALAHLLYSREGGGGFVLLTGEIGTGKTTVARCFLQQMPAHGSVAYIFNPKLSAAELLQTICHEFGVDVQAPHGGTPSTKDHLDPLNAYLLRSHAAGRHNILVIDEAQNLSADVLEQLRLLTNLETSERKLLQIVLIGQPELRQLLAQPELEQLAQRVVARFHLGALSAAETQIYIHHRMGVAGLQGPLPFSDNALRRIHQLTAGVPRRINLLCDRALLGAYAQGLPRVEKKVVNQAAQEVFDTATAASSALSALGRSHWKAPSLALGALAGAVSAVLLMGLLRPDSAPAVFEAAGLSSNTPAITAGTPKTGPVNPGTGTEAALRSDRVQAGAAAPATGDAASAQAPQTQAPGTQVQPKQDQPGQATLPLAPFTSPRPLAVGPLPDFADLLPSEATALRELGPWWQQPLPGDEPCLDALRAQLPCFRTPRMTLHGLRQLDRPAVLTLQMREQAPGWVLLTGMDSNTATLQAGQRRWRVPLTVLAEAWRGGYVTLWRLPPGQVGPVTRGINQAARDWVASRLQALQPGSPLATTPAALKATLQTFQKSQGLDADGVPGAMTLMQINRRSGVAEPRLGAAQP